MCLVICVDTHVFFNGGSGLLRCTIGHTCDIAAILSTRWRCRCVCSVMNVNMRVFYLAGVDAILIRSVVAHGFRDSSASKQSLASSGLLFPALDKLRRFERGSSSSMSHASQPHVPCTWFPNIPPQDLITLAKDVTKTSPYQS